MKRGNQDLVFSALKVKKIIQENKDIGKVANMSPYVISKSLEYFIKDIMSDALEIVYNSSSPFLTATHIKSAVLGKFYYSFLKDEFTGIGEHKGKKEKDNNTMLKRKHKKDKKYEDDVDNSINLSEN